MRSSHPISAGLSIAVTALLSQGCAQILGDFGAAEDGAGGASASSGLSSVSSTAANGVVTGATTGTGIGSGTGVAAGVTVGASSSTAGAGGAGGSSSTGGVDPCGMGTVGGIQDDFNDSMPEPLWVSYSAAPNHVTAQAVDGKIKITTDGFLASGSDETFAGYKSTNAPVSLAGCQMAAQIGNVSLTGSEAVRLELINDTDPTAVKTLRISVVGTTLFFHDYENGNANGADLNQKKIPYDPVAHAWWRFREENGEVFSETSPDGKTWTTQHSLVTPAFAKELRVNLTLGSKMSQTVQGTATFDNVNNPPL